MLLAGDAAHVHSPAGGQGVNLGICDGVALGHAIVAHVQSRVGKGHDDSSDAVLQAYADTRRAVAKEVIEMVGGIDAIGSLSRGWKQHWFVREPALWLISFFTASKGPWSLSGLKYRGTVLPRRDITQEQ